MISILLPLRNGETTIVGTLESLALQNTRIDELIILDDYSTDSSLELAENFLDKNKIKYKILRHKKCLGLAASYNEGIELAKWSLIVTLHQDVILEKDALKKLVEPFKDSQVVASCHVVNHPLKVWEKYNFWEKVYFARLAGKKFSGLDGKFDCFRKEALKKTGMFDKKSFRTAGEDGDMIFKLKEIGRIVPTEAEIVHLHKIDDSFGLKDIIYKQAQYSEVQGVLLRKGRIRTIKEILRAFFREILILFLLLPYLHFLGLFLIAAYAVLYSKIIFFRENKNPRFLLIPFLNVVLLFVSLLYSVKGFIYGKQKL